MLELASQNLPNGWKTTTLNVTKDSVAANALVSLFADIPECQYALCVLDADYSTTPTPNRFVSAFWTGSTTGSTWQRYRSGEYNQQNVFAYNYDCILYEGDVITVLYLEKQGGAS